MIDRVTIITAAGLALLALTPLAKADGLTALGLDDPHVTSPRPAPRPSVGPWFNERPQGDCSTVFYKDCDDRPAPEKPEKPERPDPKPEPVGETEHCKCSEDENGRAHDPFKGN